MKYHKQTLFVKEHGHGNCYQATLACLLNVEVYDVVDFSLFYHYRWFGHHWITLVNEFLSQKFKVKEVFAKSLEKFHRGEIPFPEKYRNKPYMLSDKSSRGFDHVVIYMNGIMVHDVHPDNSGVIISKDVQCSILIPIDAEPNDKEEN
jgi:hypothetical protein